MLQGWWQHCSTMPRFTISSIWSLKPNSATSFSPAAFGGRKPGGKQTRVILDVFRGLTHQGVHVSLGVVEEASFPTDQVQGVHQVRPTQVLRARSGPGARQRDQHQNQQGHGLEPQSRHALS
ncbi:hypothetical protein F7725_006425 [Dissostichus mawsoni]|uniref:Uncharacterized protein n=1 Tax=Dissostichus mawsoni TaxID=36200 RepID=A0A7J5XUU6_DISMA|nr:hypothetical protein F7725_006425 [Dissostichus mawsoni]